VEIINIGTLDRIIRTALGLSLIGLTLAGTIGPWGWIGILVLMTALFRSCPAYLAFGSRSRNK
jgi:hypothetical protein